MREPRMQVNFPTSRARSHIDRTPPSGFVTFILTPTLITNWFLGSSVVHTRVHKVSIPTYELAVSRLT